MRFLAVVLIIAAVWAGAFYFINQKHQSSAPETVLSYIHADADMIRVESPEPGGEVERTFTVSGEARGTWYFEASFPIQIIDPSGAVLFEGPITTREDWMTTELVPFSEEVTVPGTYTGPATLVLKKDNPSGEPERDASVLIPVVIK